MTERLLLSPAQARRLADEFGTPLYVLSEPVLRARARRYQTAFRAAYGPVRLSYASKANSTLALLRVLYEEGYGVDVASEGELRAALAAGVPAAECHLHGNYKTPGELAFAQEVGVGAVVADSREELAALARLGWSHRVLLRLSPAVDPVTHRRISTGQADSKFGFPLDDASGALAQALGAGLRVVGLHCHVGSQLSDPEAQRAGGAALAEFAVRAWREQGFVAREINVGGGLAAVYTDESPMPVEAYCRLVADGVLAPLREAGYPADGLTLAQEPGRWLVAEAGVTLYRVGPVKDVPARRYVSVDGGLSDNPRPAMYGSRYAVALAREEEGPLRVATVAGRHCETDELFANVPLPADVKAGDVLQVLSTGAYHASMASNYNRFLRPPTVMLRPDGRADLVVRREGWDELLAREVV